MGNTYTYKVKETAVVSGYNIKMDTTEHTVTVKITDPNKNGKLKIEVSYKDGAAFTNTYEASGSATLSFTKNMKNRAFLDTDWFG